jgi:hypothetical protein
MPTYEDGLMNTECSAERINFHGLGGGWWGGSMGGGSVRMKRLAGCFVDHRDPELIEHSVESLVKQRVYAIALGYEDITIPYRSRFSGTFYGRLSQAFDGN